MELTLWSPAKQVEAGTCECQCGTACKGSFAPGHDARLKSMLQFQAIFSLAARKELARRNWSHFVALELRWVPRHRDSRGRFCRTTHIVEVETFFIDERDFCHARTNCTQVVGGVTEGSHDGWACSECISAGEPGLGQAARRFCKDA